MFGKIVNLFVDIVIVLVFLLIIAFVGVKLIGLTPYTVTSGSMNSIYPVGSMIYVKEIPPEEIMVGDSITFYLGKETVATHQVWDIDVEKREFRTQGVDNLDENGEIQKDASPVAYDDLIGKPIICIPKLGYFYAFTKTPMGFWLIAGIGVLAALASFLTEPEQEKTVVTSSDDNIQNTPEKKEKQNENP